MSENNSDQEQCSNDMLQLNDYCLFEIYKFLPLIDWCSLRETCTRLQTISDVCFQRQYKSLELKAKFIYGSEIEDLKMVDIKRFFRNFGRFISKLTINSKSFNPREDFRKLIPLLDRYCNELQNLKLVNIELHTHIIEVCKRLFSNLHRLVIDQCIDDEITFSACLSHCTSLKELELIRFRLIDVDRVGVGSYFANNFKTLESVSMNSCSDFQYVYVREFFVKNPQLKTLKVLRSGFQTDITTSQVFQDVCNHLPNLEELSLRFNPFEAYNTNQVSLIRLPKLRKFEIDVGHIDLDINALLIPLVENKNIENLHLASIIMSGDICQTLCKLKSLKILKLTSTNKLNRDIYTKLAELPTLMEIHIIECDNTTLGELSEFVKRSSSLKKIVFNRYDETSSITQDIFASLIEAVQVKERSLRKETLNIHLNDDDIYDIKNDFESANSRMLLENSNIIKLQTLEDEEVTTVYEFGSGFKRPGNVRDDVFGFDDYDDMDNDDVDDFDDDFDDVDDDEFF